MIGGRRRARKPCGKLDFWPGRIARGLHRAANSARGFLTRRRLRTHRGLRSFCGWSGLVLARGEAEMLIRRWARCDEFEGNLDWEAVQKLLIFGVWFTEVEEFVWVYLCSY